jgi:hypothetical protein
MIKLTDFQAKTIQGLFFGLAIGIIIGCLFMVSFIKNYTVGVETSYQECAKAYNDLVYKEGLETGWKPFTVNESKVMKVGLFNIS